jgi:MazG family protein
MNSSIDVKFSHLVEIMQQLRKECPWDQQQTPESLRKYILEEAYETVDTIDQKDWLKLKDELGDLLLQIIFQSVIAQEENKFSIDSVLDNLINKLISRHPHVFGDKKVSSAKDVEVNWEKIKIKKENRKSLLSGIPESAPALLRAQRLQEKASRVSFDWEKTRDVLDKLDEEVEELKNALEQRDKANTEEELGDLFFTLVNLSRFLNVSAEDALRLSNKKFVQRFEYVEKAFDGDYDKMRQAGLEILDKFWDQAKNKEEKNDTK